MRKKTEQEPDKNESLTSPIDEALTSSVDEPLPTPSINQSDFAHECLQILMNLVRNENTPYRSRENAAKIVLEHLDKTKLFHTPENSKSVMNPLDQKITELEEATKLLLYRKNLANLEDRHLLPPNHPLYEAEDTSDIRIYKATWKLTHHNESYPESIKELKECHDQWVRKIEARKIDTNKN